MVVLSNLFDILINDILGVFIDVNLLNDTIGIADWSLSYIDIFKILFTCVASFIVVWLFLIFPFKILQKIMRYRDIKGGRK